MRVVEIFDFPDGLPSVELPLFISTIAAGFPSPAEGAKDDIDIVQHLIKNKNSTFLLRVSGDSMVGAGMYDNDIIVVDRSLDPHHGNIAVVLLAGEFTVKRLHYEKDYLLLKPENPKYQVTKITADQLDIHCQVWGIVTSVIHSVHPLSGYSHVRIS